MFQKHVFDFDKGKTVATCNNLISLKFSLPANMKSKRQTETLIKMLHILTREI